MLFFKLVCYFLLLYVQNILETLVLANRALALINLVIFFFKHIGIWLLLLADIFVNFLVPVSNSISRNFFCTHFLCAISCFLQLRVFKMSTSSYRRLCLFYHRSYLLHMGTDGMPGQKNNYYSEEMRILTLTWNRTWTSTMASAKRLAIKLLT